MKTIRQSRDQAQFAANLCKLIIVCCSRPKFYLEFAEIGDGLLVLCWDGDSVDRTSRCRERLDQSIYIRNPSITRSIQVVWIQTNLPSNVMGLLDLRTTSLNVYVYVMKTFTTFTNNCDIIYTYM